MFVLNLPSYYLFYKCLTWFFVSLFCSLWIAHILWFCFINLFWLITHTSLFCCICVYSTQFWLITVYIQIILQNYIKYKNFTIVFPFLLLAFFDIINIDLNFAYIMSHTIDCYYCVFKGHIWRTSISKKIE